MPAKSSKQRRFMGLVYGVQKGKVPASKVGGDVAKAANTMSRGDVKDFLMNECGLLECGVDVKQRILKALKEVRGQMKLGEDEEHASPNPIASSKTFHGDFQNTVKMYRGFELTPKENQAIQNFDAAEPVSHNKFKVEYSKGDDYGNNSTIVVKKLRQPDGKFCYTAIVKVRAGEDKPEEPETPPEAEQPAGGPPEAPPPMKEIGEPSSGGEEIKIIKSSPIDGQGGEEILTNFLQSVYRTKA